MHALLITSAVVALVFAAPAMAADLPIGTVPAPTHAAPAPLNWSGFNVGVFGGLAASTDALDLTAPGGAGGITANVTGNGWLGGARVGYDFDLGGPVLGVYADYAAANIGAQIDGTFDLGGGTTGTFNIHDKLQGLGTVQAKAGETFGDLMAYVHGGVAFGHTETALNATIAGGGGGSLSSTQDRTGFTIGAGLAYRVTNNLEINTEYGYYDLGSASVATIGGLPLNDKLTFNTATVGLSYHF